MELLDHLARMRRGAVDRRNGGALMVIVSVLIFAFGFVGPSIPFVVIGIVMAVVGGIVAGAAKRRIEDIDTQIIQAS